MNLCLTMRVLRIKQRAYESKFSYFLVTVGLHFPDLPDAVESNVSVQT